MEDLRHKNLAELFELLNEYTVKYSHFLRDGASEEDFETCSKALKTIQAEIKFRKTYNPEFGYNHFSSHIKNNPESHNSNL